MKSGSTELKVGLFAILVICVLTYMTFKVGSLPFLWEKGYRIFLELEDISGLDERSRIKIAGVDAGIVERIDLIEGKARLVLLMNPDIKLYRNAKAALKMAGLLGDKYLALTTGSPDQPQLQNGETIIYKGSIADVDALAGELTSAAGYMSDLAKNLNAMFGEQEKEALSETLLNIRDFTRDLNEISRDNKEPLNSLLTRLERFAQVLDEQGPGLIENLNRVVVSLGEKGPGMIDDLSMVAKDLKEVIEENRVSFKESVENMKSVSASASSIAQKLDRGEGTLGKLMEDDSLYDSLARVSKEAEKSVDVVGRLRTFMNTRTEYNSGEGEWKGYFDLTLQPDPEKYYILGVVSDPTGSVETTTRVINGSTVIEEETTSKIEFTAQFARRFQDLALRIGIMESTFGFGADYFFYDDSGRIKIDVWDLDAEEAKAEYAHVRAGVDYRLFKYLFISSGIDNILNSNRRGIYVGGGLKFEDKDFKYIFGKSPNISLP